MYGYFNNDPLLSCSAFHYVSMLFPISNIHEKESRKQQQQTNEKRQKKKQQTNEKDSYLKIKNPKQKTHNKNNP